MKKNAYFWVFVGIAVLTCTLLLMLASGLSNKNSNENSMINSPNPKMRNKDVQSTADGEVDLTQENIDFEDDAEDLADSFVDDSQFDEVDSLDSIEEEVY